MERETEGEYIGMATIRTNVVASDVAVGEYTNTTKEVRVLQEGTSF